MRRHITPSLIISLLALFIATSGASYAALQIPKNSVGSKQLKQNAVTSKKVKDGSLLATDFKAGQLPEGPQGAQGPQGPQGGPGPAGSDANVRAYTTPVDATTTALTIAYSPMATLNLPAGNYVVMSRANLTASANSVVICSLADDAAQNISVDSGKAVALSQNSTVTLASPGSISLYCSKSSGTVSVQQRWITAIKVSSIN